MVDLVPVGFGKASREHSVRGGLRENCQGLLRGAPFHHLLIGILILDLAKVEPALVSYVGAGLDCIGEGRKAPFHLVGGFEVPVHIALAPEPQAINRRPLPDGGHHILERPDIGRMIENVAGRHTAHGGRSRHRIEPVKPCDVVGPAAQCKGHMRASTEDSLEIAEIGHGRVVGLVRHENRHLPVGVGYDIIPVE